MIANAGISPTASFLDSKLTCITNSCRLQKISPQSKATVQDLDKCYAVNVRGTLLLYQYAAKQMIKQGRGGRLMGMLPF